MPDFAYTRIAKAQPMPGIFVVNDRMSVRQVIDELLLINRHSEQIEWNETILYLPL